MMKRKNRKLKLLSLTLVLGMLFTGCGGASADKSASTTEAVAEAPEAEAVAEEASDAGAYLSDDVYMGANGGMALEDAVTEEESAQEEEKEAGELTETKNLARKLIRNVNLEVETETFEELLATVEDKTKSLSGYIEESYTYNGSNYYGRGTRNANMTIRIPAERLDEFLSAVSEVSNVISRNESVTDVTLQYVDMESHKKALQAEQDRLLELLEKAETIEDIISLESRLSEVRYQIESMESQLRTMDNQVSYSTVYLYIEEVTKLTPVKEQTVWEKISTGFVNSLYRIGNGFTDFVIGFIIALPYLIVWAVIIVSLVLIIRMVIRRSKKKKQLKHTEAEEKEKENE